MCGFGLKSPINVDSVSNEGEGEEEMKKWVSVSQWSLFVED